LITVDIRRYLFVWLGLTGVLLGTVALVNLVIDPYGLFRLIDRPGINNVKPTAGAHGGMIKAYQVLRVQPRGLILGNSRAEVGLDPRHPGWPRSAQPVFNLALPGTGTHTTLRNLQHVLHAESQIGKPVVVIWGIDFMDFLVDARQQRKAGAFGKDDRRLLALPDGSANPSRPMQIVRDYTESTLTLSAFLDSMETLRTQGNPHAADLTPLGFNPMRDYLAIAATEGYRSLFWQRDLQNMRDYLRRPRDIFDGDGRSSPALDDLRQILKLCRENGIDLRLAIYPYHAHLSEIIHLTGHRPAFEDWKRAVVHIVDEDARAGGGVPIWDFSAINALTSENVPGKGDLRTKMRWYWEAGHYKQELGDLMQDRIFNGANAKHPEFGILLTKANLESVIEADQRRATVYRIDHAADFKELADMAARLTSKGK
jgi:hypothetical protein